MYGRNYGEQTQQPQDTHSNPHTQHTTGSSFSTQQSNTPPLVLDTTICTRDSCHVKLPHSRSFVLSRCGIVIRITYCSTPAQFDRYLLLRHSSRQPLLTDCTPPCFLRLVRLASISRLDA